MKFVGEPRNLRWAGRIGSLFAAIALIFTLPASGLADDFDFSESAIDDHVLAETHGVGQDGVLLFRDEEQTGNGSSQSIDIGSLNEGSGFGSHNAVAVAIVRQDAVQIIGAGDIGNITRN